MPKSDESLKTKSKKTKRKTGLGTSAFFQTVPLPQTSQSAEQQTSKPVSQQASKPTNQQTSKPTNQQANKPASQQTSKLANQQASKPVNQQVSKPVSQQVSKSVSQQASKPVSQQASKPVSQQTDNTFALAAYATDSKTKATYYLTDSTLDRLEDITNVTKRFAATVYGRSRRKDISKSFLVEAALHIVLEDFAENKNKSLLTKKLANYLQGQ